MNRGLYHLPGKCSWNPAFLASEWPIPGFCGHRRADHAMQDLCLFLLTFKGIGKPKNCKEQSWFNEQGRWRPHIRNLGNTFLAWDQEGVFCLLLCESQRYREDKSHTHKDLPLGPHGCRNISISSVLCCSPRPISREMEQPALELLPMWDAKLIGVA